MTGRAAPPRRVGAVVHLVVRIVLGVVLVVLLVANGVKHAPAIAAALSPASSASTGARTLAAGAASPSAAPASASASAAQAAPTVSAPTVSLPPLTLPSEAAGHTSSGSGTRASATAHPTTSAPPALRVTSMSGADVQCPQPNGGQFSTSAPTPEATISWTSIGATKAWFGIDTQDAEAQPYEQVDPNGSITVNWSCPDQTDIFAITIVNASGGKATRILQLRNTGYSG